jgi:hypothetical protein
VSHRTRLAFVLVGLLSLVATLVSRLGTQDSVAAVSSTLHAKVGPGYTISITFDDGTAALALPAGAYRVVVSDLSDEHNFHLFGPGVDESTSVENDDSPTWTVTFRNNARYVFQCDPHADSMFGAIDVGTPAPEQPSSSGGSSGGGTAPGTTQPATATGRVVATLVAGVDSRGKVRLTLGGKPVKQLRQGSYRIRVTDSTKNDDFTLRRIGASRTPLTGVAFVGGRTIATDLKAGQWKAYSSAHEAATGVFFRVTR